MTETKNIDFILKSLRLTIEAIEENNMGEANEYFDNLLDSRALNKSIYNNYDEITDVLDSVGVFIDRDELRLKHIYDPGYLRLAYRDLETEVKEKTSKNQLMFT